MCAQLFFPEQKTENMTFMFSVLTNVHAHNDTHTHHSGKLNAVSGVYHDELEYLENMEPDAAVDSDPLLSATELSDT